MAARRLSKNMYKNQKITKSPKTTKYELCIYIYYKIKMFFVFYFSKVSTCSPKVRKYFGNVQNIYIYTLYI